RCIKADVLCFSWCEFNWLLDRLFADIGGEDTFDGSGRIVAQIRGDRQFGCRELRIQLRFHKGITNRDRSSRSDSDFFPDAEILVRRRGIPVDPSNAEVLLCGSADFKSDHVFFTRFCKLRQIEFENTIRAGNFLCIADFLPVEPDICAVINAGKLNTEVFLCECGGKIKFISPPPCALERGAFWHFLVCTNNRALSIPCKEI